MIPEQTIRKAIEKSVEGGYKPYFNIDSHIFSDSSFNFHDRLDKHFDVTHINEILFDIEFWQGLVGEKQCCYYCGNTDKEEKNCPDCSTIGLGTISYNYHLQQIAILNNSERIIYLKQFIND